MRSFLLTVLLLLDLEVSCTPTAWLAVAEAKGRHPGTYHSVSTKWLQSYLDECAWRYNHREFTRRLPGVRRVPVGEAKFRLLLGLACRPTA